jgi:hypothetical protein
MRIKIIWWRRQMGNSAFLRRSMWIEGVWTLHINIETTESGRGSCWSQPSTLQFKCRKYGAVLGSK